MAYLVYVPRNFLRLLVVCKISHMLFRQFFQQGFVRFPIRTIVEYAILRGYSRPSLALCPRLYLPIVKTSSPLTQLNLHYGQPLLCPFSRLNFVISSCMLSGIRLAETLEGGNNEERFSVNWSCMCFEVGNCGFVTPCDLEARGRECRV